MPTSLKSQLGGGGINGYDYPTANSEMASWPSTNGGFYPRISGDNGAWKNSTSYVYIPNPYLNNGEYALISSTISYYNNDNSARFNTTITEGSGGLLGFYVDAGSLIVPILNSSAVNSYEGLIGFAKIDLSDGSYTYLALPVAPPITDELQFLGYNNDGEMYVLTSSETGSNAICHLINPDNFTFLRSVSVSNLLKTAQSPFQYLSKNGFTAISRCTDDPISVTTGGGLVVGVSWTARRQLQSTFDDNMQGVKESLQTMHWKTAVAPLNGVESNNARNQLQVISKDHVITFRTSNGLESGWKNGIAHVYDYNTFDSWVNYYGYMLTGEKS